jgi:hypothetical protein
MTKKNKIIVAVVAVLAMIMLGGLIFWLFKPPAEGTENSFDLSVPAPGIDSAEGELQKLKGYNKEDVAFIKVGDGGPEAPETEQRRLDSLAAAIGLLDSRKGSDNKSNPYGEGDRFRYGAGNTGRGRYTGAGGRGRYSDDTYPDEEDNDYAGDLERIRDRQRQLLSSIKDISAGNGTHEGVVDLDSLLKIVNQRNQKNDSVPLTTSFGPPKAPSRQSFYGAGWTGSTDGSVLLTPLEAIENKLLKQGETLPLRTLKEINLRGRRIPAGTVLYGKIAVSDRRLNIKVTGIILNNTLVPATFAILDYDGLPGIELKGNEWFQIPAEVTEDVYKAALSTYQQQQFQIGGVGGVNRVPLKDIATLSAADKVAREAFAKIRVFVPYKYRLWLKIDDNNDLK